VFTMAHKGKHYPIYQFWRMYTPEAQTLAGYPPRNARVRVQNWSTIYTQPPVNTWITCQPFLWTPGDYLIRYRSGSFSSMGHQLRIMVMGQVYGPGFMRWKMGCLDNNVDQIPWGWFDYPNHPAWHPGQVDNILIAPPAGATFSPHGITEIQAVPWP
jgi:hypothetical protein